MVDKKLNFDWKFIKCNNVDRLLLTQPFVFHTSLQEWTSASHVNVYQYSLWPGNSSPEFCFGDHSKSGKDCMQGGLYCIFFKTSIRIFEYSNNIFTSLLWYKGLGYFDLKKNYWLSILPKQFQLWNSKITGQNEDPLPLNLTAVSHHRACKPVFCIYIQDVPCCIIGNRTLCTHQLDW